MSLQAIHEVLKRAEELKSELISLASNLIRFRTVSPPSNTLECAEYIKSYSEECGLETKTYSKEREG